MGLSPMSTPGTTTNLHVRYFRGLSKDQEVLLTHADSINKPGDGMKVIATSGNLTAGKFSAIPGLYIHSSTISPPCKYEVKICLPNSQILLSWASE
jgi:hypothetical protein